MRERTFLLAILLSCFGLATQYLFGRTFVLNQLLYVCVGILMYMIIVRFVNPQTLLAHVHVISLVGIAALISLLLFGTPVRGSRRWFRILSAGFQPSIFFTSFFTISLAQILNSNPARSVRSFLRTVLLILVPALLVFRQPDLGTSLLILITLSWVFLYSGIPLLYLIITAFSIVPIIFVTPLLLHNYQLDRIVSFLNPQMDPYGLNYNSLQALIAIGSGGFLGKGILNASQSQLQFLPEAHTDFVFASFIEAYGFFGGFLLLTAITIFLYSLLSAVAHTKNRIASLYAVGLCMFIFVQYAFNVGMNLRIFPVVGVPLPFISTGGTGIITLFISLALLKKLKDI